VLPNGQQYYIAPLKLLPLKEYESKTKYSLEINVINDNIFASCSKSLAQITHHKQLVGMLIVKRFLSSKKTRS
jgi:hypothetical protein